MSTIAEIDKVHPRCAKCQGYVLLDPGQEWEPGFDVCRECCRTERRTLLAEVKRLQTGLDDEQADRRECNRKIYQLATELASKTRDCEKLKEHNDVLKYSHERKSFYQEAMWIAEKRADDKTRECEELREELAEESDDHKELARKAENLYTRCEQQAALIERIQRRSRAAVNHWNEFGPEHDFWIEMQNLEAALALTPEQALAEQQNGKRNSHE